MMTDDEIITCGQYKNKTFEYVYENDKVYCHRVYSGGEQFCENLNAFREFVKCKENAIEKFQLRDFVASLNETHTEEFERLLASCLISSERVHDASRNRKTSATLEMFYNLFLRKLLFNSVRNSKIYHTDFLELFTIFPVALKFDRTDDGDRTTPAVISSDNVVQMLQCIRNDATAVKEIEEFIAKYKFSEEQDIFGDLEQMLISIDLYTEGNPVTKIRLLLSRNYYDRYRSKYIDTLKRYILYYRMCKDSYLTCLRYRNRPYPFTVVHPQTLSKRLDSLYCYRMYVTHSGQVMELVEEMFKLARFWNGRKGSGTIKDVDYSVLKNLIRYVNDGRYVNVENFIVSPATSLMDYVKTDNATTEKTDNGGAELLLANIISSADRSDSDRVTDFAVDNCFLKGEHTVYYDGKLVEFCYSNKGVYRFSTFYSLILCASLLKVPCSKLIIYNARLGEEVCMETSFDKEAIKNFIRKYNRSDASKHIPILKHLI